MNKKLMLIIWCAMLSNQVSAQLASYPNIELSNKFPAAGNKIDVSYRPAANFKASQKVILKAFFWRSKTVIDTVVANAGITKGKPTFHIAIPDSAKAFALAFYADTALDNNQGKGYLYNLFNSKKESAKESYATLAYIYRGGVEDLGIVQNRPEALTLINKEIALYPATPGDNIMMRYYLMTDVKKEPLKAQLFKELYQRLKSGKELDLDQAANGFGYAGNKEVADSILKAERAQFPLGRMARGEGVNEIYRETDPLKKEKIYQAWIVKFSPENFGQDRKQYDYVRTSIAQAFANAKDSVKALQYANLVETPWLKPHAYNEIAHVLFAKGQYSTAQSLYKRAVDLSYSYLTDQKNEEGADRAANSYPEYCFGYAQILLQQKQYNQALDYVKKAESYGKAKSPAVEYVWAKILVELNQNQEAFDKIDGIIKTGVGAPSLEDYWKQLYVKAHGSDNGFDTYAASVKQQIANKQFASLKNSMVNLAAPPFTLTDLDGQKVSLASLKGSVVVLDFWATWCGPCKKSFPTMQKTMHKYKNDAGVKFLFIHTWETSTDPVTDARKYITGMKYDFRVLMDIKDPVTKVNKVVTDYHITGIPQKYVIDKNGRIRFQVTGFDGNEDAGVSKLSSMIELTKSATETPVP